jgi:predicted metal-dependent peptidase
MCYVKSVEKPLDTHFTANYEGFMAKEIKKENLSLSIEKEIVALIKYKPFYAHFIQTMRRVITKDVKTMGVNITDGLNLYINPEFFNTLTPQERVACLEHEVLHVINKHLIRGKSLQPQIFNIAADIAVNQYIREERDNNQKVISKLPKQALLPQQFKFPAELTSEEYYKLLMKNSKKINIKNGAGGKEGEQQQTLDDHDIWKDGNGNEDFQHQVIKNAIRKTLENTKDYGHLPSGVIAELQKALRHETMNWRAILQRFLHKATIINYLPTRKRPNRRYGLFYDGNKVECKLDLLVAVDTSGSISDGDLALFFSEIEKIKALGMKVLIVECDAAIQKVYPFKTTPKIVCGRGGTDFKPIFKYAAERKPKPNSIIYLTDLCADLNFKNISNIPTLWAITSSGGNEKDVPFGVGIKLKEDDRDL